MPRGLACCGISPPVPSLLAPRGFAFPVRRANLGRNLAGLAYGGFSRALDNRNNLAALSTAAKLPNVGLTDALELVLRLLDKAPEG